MASRMDPKKFTKLTARSQAANELNVLARRALGDNTTSVQQKQARAELEQRVGTRRANALQEQELQRAGAPAKGVRRLFR